jgi:salicylate hydroxylase
MKCAVETHISGKRKLSEAEIESKEMTTEDGRDSNSLFSVAIIGGGIAGLGAALALQQKGFRVSVFERDSLFEDRRQGYGLTLTNNPKGPLADLNLLDECIARDCPSNAHWIFEPEGNVLGYYGRSFKAKAKEGSVSDNLTNESVRSSCQNATVEGRGNLRIPRQNLRKMMLDRLNPGTVRWGMKLLDYTESSKCVTAQFQHENSDVGDLTPENPVKTIEDVSVDILVGADGIRSVVRQLRSQKVGVLGNNKLISESSPLHYVGVAVILGITSATHPLINQQVSPLTEAIVLPLFLFPCNCSQHQALALFFYRDSTVWMARIGCLLCLSKMEA